MGEEVIHDRTLFALGEGGEGATLPLLQLVEDGLGVMRVSHCRPSWLDVCACCRTCSTLDERAGGGHCSAPPSHAEGGLISRCPSSPRKTCAIIVNSSKV